MKDFRCPVCYDKLKVTGQARLETLNEHIWDPMKDKYECVNVDCPAFIHKAFWNEDGEYYIRDFKAKISFIDNNNAPFGSSQRQMNVEIYKKDENYILLNLYYFKIKVKFDYKSNENGSILKRKRRFLILKRDKVGWVHWLSPWRMFFFHMKQFKRDLKQLNNKLSYEYKLTLVRRLKREYFNDIDKRFYRKMAKMYINLFYSKIENEISIILDHDLNRQIFKNT
ncbi:hypothetical protein LCGC14_2937450 [marine sediment metagenome]|uniref:Uncharacterized protein n=1 Tax=marine sediment metagenome TaxID=412755 RepID=A0A0F8Y651_9ZZZZ